MDSNKLKVLKKTQEILNEILLNQMNGQTQSPEIMAEVTIVKAIAKEVQEFHHKWIGNP